MLPTFFSQGQQHRIKAQILFTVDSSAINHDRSFFTINFFAC